MNELITQLVEFVKTSVVDVGFFPSLLFFSLVGLYLFWYEAQATRKNRNSTFDMFLFTMIVTLLWGRLSYILANPQDFQGLVWSWVPYERYEDGIYYFRLLPWKYFKLWDGGFLYISMFSSFIISGFLFSSLVKKWRWREMIGAVFVSGVSMLGLSLLVTGFYSENAEILQQGGVILSLSLVYSIANMSLKKLYKKNQSRYEKSFFMSNFAFSIISSVYILLALLNSDVTVIDRYNLYLVAAFVIISAFAFIIDMQRKNITVSTITVGRKSPRIGSTVKIRSTKK